MADISFTPAPELSRLLGYQFRKIEMLAVALTHRSFGGPNNERLEFLGDAILSYIVAEDLLQRFRQASEGDLTRLRANLVRGETLARVARDRLDLGRFIRLGPGELKSGGWRRSSILSDTLEALIGAVYLDGGMEACKRVVLNLLEEELVAVSPRDVRKDSKTRLQEYLQAQRRPLPSYRVLNVEGAAHEQHFSVECVVAGLTQPTHGEGSSRRHAEQSAAEKALDMLHQGRPT